MKKYANPSFQTRSCWQQNSNTPSKTNKIRRYDVILHDVTEIRNTYVYHQLP